MDNRKDGLQRIQNQDGKKRSAVFWNEKELNVGVL